MKKQERKEEKGITLVALVVTIIVLIILAGVSIAMLVGENGIVTQTQIVAQDTEIKGDEEKIRLAMVAAQIANNGDIALKGDIEIALLENGTKSIVVDNEDGTRNIIFLDSRKIYKINNDGSIENTNSDFDSIYVAPASQDDARNEGVNIRMEILTGGAGDSSVKNIDFTVDGAYVAIMDFISAIEDDSELAFRIENFNMLPSGDNLQATFSVTEIRIRQEQTTATVNNTTSTTDSTTNTGETTDTSAQS